MGRMLDNKIGLGLVAGAATILLTCLGIPKTASSNAIAPDNQAALLTIQGQGVNPQSKISLSTGPKQTIVTNADRSGQFVFSNLKYASFTDLNFTIDIPSFEKGLAKNYSPSHLTFRYNPQESMIYLDGHIGKSGTLAFNLGGANASVVQTAGHTGYVRLQTRTNQPMVSGQSALTASIINTSEICCPNMIVPNNPVTLTILSEPIAMAQPIPVPAPPPQNIPAVNMPVPPQATPPAEQITPPVKMDKSPADSVPYIILPKKDGEQDKPKPKIPYIVQGRIEVNDLPVIVSDDIVAATSFPSATYDATYVGGLKKVSREMLNSILLDIAAMGGFLDGRDQMDANRALQLSITKSLKNYTPSTTICRFGSMTRSVATASSNADKNQLGFTKILLDRPMQKSFTVYSDPGEGVNRMIEDFKKNYCDKKDNGGFLEGYCATSAATGDKLYNHDVDFTRVFDVPLTIDADFADSAAGADREGMIALFTNLSYTPPLMSSSSKQWDPVGSAPQTQDIRALESMKMVAANSFGALVGQKTKSSANKSATYLNEVLKELGTSTGDITKLIGDNPSYFAQMEILTKKMFQSPAFYANLYESEANIDRQRVAMKAIELQQDRDFLESLRRREMLLSVLLNAKLKNPASAANASGVVIRK